MPNKKLEAHRPGKETRYKGYWLTKFVDFFPVLGFLAIVLVFGIATKGKMFLKHVGKRLMIKWNYLKLE